MSHILIISMPVYSRKLANMFTFEKYASRNTELLNVYLWILF